MVCGLVIFLQKKMRMTFVTDNLCLFSRKYNFLRPVIAPRCKLGEIFLLENGFEKILDIEVENGAFS